MLISTEAALTFIVTRISDVAIATNVPYVTRPQNYFCGDVIKMLWLLLLLLLYDGKVCHYNGIMTISNDVVASYIQYILKYDHTYQIDHWNHTKLNLV